MKHYHHDPMTIVGVEGVIYNESGEEQWHILVHDDQYVSGGFDVIQWREKGRSHEKVLKTHACSRDELAQVLNDLDVEWVEV
ncbi:MAG: hypothetical protein JWQ64_2017 [Subtercola sp.]|jgi:hypothetical protein|nr:hypothetical protein [Subtercola sp.]